MWYFFKCPECQRPISTYETQDNNYIVPKLMDEVKQHYVQNHNIDKLLSTDEELTYEIKTKEETSQKEPTW